MKRLLCLLLILGMLPLNGLAASKAKTEVKLSGDMKLTLTAGKYEAFTQTFTGVWESSDPTIANAEVELSDNKKVRLVGYREGSATLTLTGTKTKKTAVVQVTVTADPSQDDPVPDLIRGAVDFGIQEWRENGEQRMEDSVKTNKYLKWWRESCGWCGVFVTYCLKFANVPMAGPNDQHKVKPLGSGDPYSIEVAGVGRFHDAFTNMERLTKHPRPGYLVIYGKNSSKEGGSAYDFVHIGLVTDVVPRADGTYQVSTVEGNWGRMVTRFSYIYDPLDVTHHNMAPVPAEDQADPDIPHYEPHKDYYFVYEFCQTWY